MILDKFKNLLWELGLGDKEVSQHQIFNLIYNSKYDKLVKLINEEKIKIHVVDSHGRNVLFNLIGDVSLLNFHFHTFKGAQERAKSMPKILEVIDALIKHGININQKDNIGNTPIMFSVLYNTDNVFDILIDNGASLKSDIKNIFEESVYRGNIHIINRLLEHPKMIFDKELLSKINELLQKDQLKMKIEDIDKERIVSTIMKKILEDGIDAQNNRNKRTRI